MKSLLLLVVIFSAIYVAVQGETANCSAIEDLRPKRSTETGSKDIKETNDVGGRDYCECVSSSLCSDPNSFVRTDVICKDTSEVCCKLQDQPTSYKSKGCGVRNPKGIGYRPAGADHESEFGEFPWMSAVLLKLTLPNTKEVLTIYQCGASLIHPQVVLTAAHCVNIKEEKYRVRVGEWDSQTKDELFPHQDREVKAVVIHPHFQNVPLLNDIALLILDTPVEITENIDVACLPTQNMAIEKGRCLASGWGKDTFDKGGKYYAVLKKLELPIVRNNVCQDRLRTTSLGKKFELDSSFICAGGVADKDTCKGDGGSPLVYAIPGRPDRYVQVGIVSWGVGCGEDQIPGVYTNVAMFAEWIDEQMAVNNFSTSYYKY